jgi:predicted phage terminase large subunit-like protein
MTEMTNVLDAVRRERLLFFVAKAFEQLHPDSPPLTLSWYLEAMCWAMEEAAREKIPRCLLNVPPRTLKSIVASVALVAWLLGHDPTKRIMVATYSLDLARQHHNQCRQIMESEWYQRLFPGTCIDDRENRALEFVTTKGGGRKAVSVGGSVTGFGAHLIIIDDCMKAEDARSQTARDAVKLWCDGTLMTRMNDAGGGAVISIQQRLGEDDLSNHLLEKGYHHVCLPAIAEKAALIPLGRGRFHRREPGDLLDPLRFPQAVLDGLRRDYGPAVFAAQYQQSPVAPEGNLLKWDWFKHYSEKYERADFQKIVQSWDTANSDAPTCDFSVCTTWGFRENKWHLLDVFRERLDYPHLKKAVIRLKRQWQADRVVIEDAGSGKSLFQELRSGGPFLPLMWSVTEDKETRLAGVTAQIEEGLIVLPTEALWLDAFRSELMAFPHGRYDDQVDSMTQFIEFQRRHKNWAHTRYDETGRPINIIRPQNRLR